MKDCCCRGSLGASEVLVISGVTSLKTSFSLSIGSACSVTSLGLLELRGSMDKAFSIGLATLEAASSGEAKEPITRIMERRGGGGSTHS